MKLRVDELTQSLFLQGVQMGYQGWLVSAGILFTLHCLIGLGAALVARHKGLSFKRWLWLGLLGGTIALITVLRHSESIAKS
jgi:hypothetical protein